jgi:hypothetical protein
LPFDEVPIHEGDGVLLCESPEDVLEGVRESIAPDGESEHEWCRYVPLPGGGDYLRWENLFEFLVSGDGRQILARRLDQSNEESFQTYVLNQVLAFSLVRQGVEPLHATVIEVSGRALAILGDCGYGKSTLGAAFLAAGYRMVTDDLLVLRESQGGLFAYPGPARIKLLPEAAELLPAEQTAGVPMNPLTNKRIIPLGTKLACREPVPLKGIYVLVRPAATSTLKRVVIRRVPPAKAFVHLLAHAFNKRLNGPTRARQQFAQAVKVASLIPIKTLTYPASLSELPRVVQRIIADVVR